MSFALVALDGGDQSLTRKSTKTLFLENGGLEEVRDETSLIGRIAAYLSIGVGKCRVHPVIVPDHLREARLSLGAGFA